MGYKNKTAGIYKITNPNGKVNIGQSWWIEKRFGDYRCTKAKGQPKLNNSLLKYGHEAHIFEIVHELPQDATQEVMNTYEILYWQLYKDCGADVMNVKEPGSKGKHSQETKDKISKANTGKKCSQLLKDKLSVLHKGVSKKHVVSEETRLKLSIASTGKKCSKETKLKLSIINTGKIHSEEMKIKLSSVMKNLVDDNMRNRMREVNSKKVMCNETGVSFDSITDASQRLGIGTESITRTFIGKSNRKGWTFKLI